MLKDVRKKIMLVALVALALGNAISVSAETTIDVNYAEYTGYVKKLEDLVTDPLYKTTLTDGTNRPIVVQNGSSLCSWINNYLGNRVTNKVYYNSSGPLYMTYTEVADIENPGYHLSTTLTVSTQILEFRTVYTDGLWSPDYF